MIRTIATFIICSLVGIRLATAQGLPSEAEEHKAMSGKFAVSKYIVDGVEKAESVLKTMRVERDNESWTLFVGNNETKYADALYPKRSPREIDITNTSDKAMPTSVGIYERKEEIIRICFSSPNGKKRPTKFEAPTGSGLTLIELRPFAAPTLMLNVLGAPLPQLPTDDKPLVVRSEINAPDGGNCEVYYRSPGDKEFTKAVGEQNKIFLRDVRPGIFELEAYVVSDRGGKSKLVKMSIYVLPSLREAGALIHLTGGDISVVSDGIASANEAIDKAVDAVIAVVLIDYSKGLSSPPDLRELNNKIEDLRKFVQANANVLRWDSPDKNADSHVRLVVKISKDCLLIHPPKSLPEGNGARQAAENEAREIFQKELKAWSIRLTEPHPFTFVDAKLLSATRDRAYKGTNGISMDVRFVIAINYKQYQIFTDWFFAALDTISIAPSATYKLNYITKAYRHNGENLTRYEISRPQIRGIEAYDHIKVIGESQEDRNVIAISSRVGAQVPGKAIVVPNGTAFSNNIGQFFAKVNFINANGKTVFDSTVFSDSGNMMVHADSLEVRSRKDKKGRNGALMLFSPSLLRYPLIDSTIENRKVFLNNDILKDISDPEKAFLQIVPSGIASNRKVK